MVIPTISHLNNLLKMLYPKRNSQSVWTICQLRAETEELLLLLSNKASRHASLRVAEMLSTHTSVEMLSILVQADSMPVQLRVEAAVSCASVHSVWCM